MGEWDAPDLDEFVKRYSEDDNEWWMAASGDHQNYFDHALERLEEMTAQRDGLLAMMTQAQVVLGHPRIEPCPPQGDVRSWSIAWLRQVHDHSVRE